MDIMTFEELPITGAFKIECDHFEDTRGSVTKVFTESVLKELGATITFKESFFSTSHKNVIRGMHFQTHASTCSKLVYVPKGTLLDVILDLRRDAPTFGKHVSLELSQKNHTAVFIPAGCAHGFLALEDNTYTAYLQSEMRKPEEEGGVHFDSFGMDWGISNPILSERDLNLPTFASYTSQTAAV